MDDLQVQKYIRWGSLGSTEEGDLEREQTPFIWAFPWLLTVFFVDKVMCFRLLNAVTSVSYSCQWMFKDTMHAKQALML